MKYRDLILSVKKSRFRMDDPSKDHANKEYLAKRDSILERDNYTCQYCGFRAKKFQEIHHLDNNHQNNADSNLITACTLCHMVNHVGFAGIRQIAKLIYIDPKYNVSQAQLNQVVRSLWVAKTCTDNPDLVSNASSLLARIHKYIILAHMKINTPDPAILADFMLNIMTDEQYEKRGEYFKGIYLLPLEAGFEKHIKYWSKSVFPKNSKWESIAFQRYSKWLQNEEGDGSKASVLNFLDRDVKA